jgi:hypothetical protein
MKWCWILSKAVSVSIEMTKWFLSLLLLMCCITFIDLCMLNHTLHPWDEANLVIVSDIYDMLLDSVCHYFVEDFCIDVH